MKDPSSLARLIQEAIAQLGADASPVDVTERVARLQKGLPAEDEFSAVLAWLGQCQLVHKLDQLQRPLASKEVWQVPDLLAVFDYHGRSVPVLIEVKTSDLEHEVLEMSVAERNRRVRYAELLGLPLLIAWRWGPFWILFDVEHMKPSPIAYKITFGQAMAESLMCELAGDFSFSLHPGSGMHIRMRKTERKGDAWTGIIEEVYWTDPAGKKHKEAPGVFPLFLSLEQESRTEHDGEHLILSFIIGEKQSMQFASRALVMLAAVGADKKGASWRTVLEEALAPPSAPKGLGDAVQAASEAGFIGNVFHIQPAHVPTFLLAPEGRPQ